MPFFRNTQSIFNWNVVELKQILQKIINIHPNIAKNPIYYKNYIKNQLFRVERCGIKTHFSEKKYNFYSLYIKKCYN